MRKGKGGNGEEERKSEVDEDAWQVCMKFSLGTKLGSQQPLALGPAKCLALLS